MGMLAWRRVQGPGAGGWCLELSWKDRRIIREQGWWGGNVCMLSVALPSNVRPCVCVCPCQRQAMESSGQREMQ
jgi:hypothetical protein